MNTATRIAALSPVALAAVGLTQVHYIISHFATIAEIGAAAAVGTAIWTGTSVMGKRKARAKDESESVDARIAELLGEHGRRAGLPQAAQVIDYTNASQAVTKRA